VPRSRMSETILPFPQYAFMAWCSVKSQGQLYFYLYVWWNVHVMELIMQSSPTSYRFKIFSSTTCSRTLSVYSVKYKRFWTQW
jgi:hypothetical protein